MNDYYYGEQIDNFTFYRVPKALFTTPRYKTLSAEAKILYGLLLDRAALSTLNGWKDERGRIFIYYTVKEIMAEIGCSKQKAIRLLDELEHKADLIRRVKQGLGKPNRIYVKNFAGVVDNAPEHISRSMKIIPQET